MAAPPVDLDALTKKQLAKEFKTVSKEIKSKDIEVKTAVLQKLNNHRYFFEGGCLPPFFESMTPKKVASHIALKDFIDRNFVHMKSTQKTLDMSRMTVEALALFLRHSARAANGESTGRAALNVLRASTGHLNSLEQLFACMAYHEEKKKPKKGQPEVPESPEAVNLRLISGEAMFLLTTALYEAPKDLHLIDLYTTVPSAVPNLCQSLKCIMPLFDDEESREKALGQLSRVLFCLASAVRSKHAPEFISNSWHEIILKLMNEKSLTVHCLQIIHSLNLHQQGTAVLAFNDEFRRLYINTLEWSVANLIASVGTGTGDAAPAKDAKAAKGAKPAKGVDPNTAGAELEAKVETNRLLASNIKLLSSLFLTISTEQSFCFSVEEVEAIMKCYSSCITNAELWKICNAYFSASGAPAVALEDTVSVMCSVIGSFGQRDNSIRDAVAESGLELLSSALIKSRTICDVAADRSSFLPDNYDEEDLSTQRIRVRKISELLSLRRCAEKGIFHLLTHNSPETTRAAIGFQWEAAANSILNPVIVDSDSFRQVVTKMLEVLGGVDEDLGNRVARLLSGIVQSSFPVVEESSGDDANSKAAVVAAIKFDQISVISKLSSFVASRAALVNNDLVNKYDASLSGEGSSPTSTVPKEINRANAINREAVALGLSCDELMYFKWEAAERRNLRTPQLRSLGVRITDSEATEGVGSFSAIKIESQTEKSDLLFPSLDETLIHGLYLVEAVLPSSSEAIVAAGTQELIGALSSIVYVAGPTGTTNRSVGVPMAHKDHMVSLYDPRVFTWREEYDHRLEKAEGSFTMVALRGLIASVLATFAAADAKYRIYEGDIPCAPGAMMPNSVSPCYQAANLVCKLSADCCFSVLLSNAQLYFSDKGELLCGPSTKAQCELGILNPSFLRPDVLNSFLKLACAIGTCGVVGASGCYNSIAAAGFGERSADPKRFSSIASLKSAIQSAIDAGLVVMEEDSTLVLNSVFKWVLPLHFDFLEDGLSPTTCGSLMSRKDIWPFIIVAASVLGSLSDPRSTTETLVLATNLLSSFSKFPQMGDLNQPAIADLLGAVFVAIGGVTTLISLTSFCGTLTTAPPETKSKVYSLLMYMISRGTARHTYWDDVRQQKLTAEAAAAAEAASASKGAKKDEKKKDEKKKDDKGKKGAVAVEEEKIDLPFEPDEYFVDPNHGPSIEQWSVLLNAKSNDYHSRSVMTNPIGSWSQSRLSDVTDVDMEVLQALLSAGVDVNIRDGAGFTPLMYGLILGNSKLIESVFNYGANPDIIDGAGNPSVMFSFLTIDASALKAESLSTIVNAERKTIWNDVSSRNSKSIQCPGSCELLGLLLQKGVDLRVSTSTEGNFPLHFACGLAELKVAICGVSFRIDNRKYAVAYDELKTESVVRSLIDHGASPKFCNKEGVLPVHLAAASGDIASIESLLRSGGGDLANMSDIEGYLPLHYAAAACPKSSIETMNLLLKWGELRPLGTSHFKDDRTSKAVEEKYWYDIEHAMAAALSFGDVSHSVSTHRLSRQEIVRCLTTSGLSPLHLSLAGRAVASSRVAKLMPLWDQVSIRIAIAEMMMDIGGDNVLSCDAGNSKVSSTGLSAIHTLSLLGVLEAKPKTFVSGSLKVISIVGSQFEPPPTLGEQTLFARIEHGENNSLSTGSVINARQMPGSSAVTLSWPVPSQLLDFISGSNMSIKVMRDDTHDSLGSCVASGEVSLDPISRGKVLIGESITLETPVYDASSGCACGSVSITIQTINDAQSNGISGPMFSNQSFFSRVLKTATPRADPCTWSLSHCRLPDDWTPLHACILSQNRILATAVLNIMNKSNSDWSSRPYLQFVARFCDNMTFCSQLIDAYAQLKSTALNRADDNEYPLHAAVRWRNTALLTSLVNCQRVNLNVRDPVTGATALLEASRRNSYSNSNADRDDIICCFQAAADRLDFLIPDEAGETCIDYAVRNGLSDLLSVFVKMRRNDVVERVLSIQNDGPDCILLALEKDNIKLTKIVHSELFAPKLVSEITKTVSNVDDDDEELETKSVMLLDPENSEVSKTEVEVVVESVDVDISVEEASALLATNERLLSVLLPCILDSGVACSEDFHAHECFSRGLLFRIHHEASFVAEKSLDEAPQLNIKDVDNSAEIIENNKVFNEDDSVNQQQKTTTSANEIKEFFSIHDDDNM